MNWTCYLIGSGCNRLTYVGVTLNEKRRLRQHNQEIKGGARYTKRSSNWTFLCVIRGFTTRSMVQKFESQVKRYRRKTRKGSGPLNGVHAMYNNLQIWYDRQSYSRDVLTFELGTHFKELYPHYCEFPKKGGGKIDESCA